MEVWRDVIGYEGQYQVSNTGMVRSTMFINNKTTKSRVKVLKQYTSTRNRCYVSLYKNGKRKNCTVHRLVARAFLPNESNLPEVNHIDGNPQNNNVSNLEWCNKEYNSRHAYENNLNPLKQYNDRHKKMLVRNDGITYSCAYECAEELGVSVCSIRDVLKGRIKTCKGYSFKYVEPCEGVI